MRLLGVALLEIRESSQRDYLFYINSLLSNKFVIAVSILLMHIKLLAMYIFIMGMEIISRCHWTQEYLPGYIPEYIP